MTPDPLYLMLRTLEEPLGVFSVLNAYYDGRQPLAFLSPEAKAAIGSRFHRMASNIPRLAVTALAERLRITGFKGPNGPLPGLWDVWLANDMDQLSGVLHREALALGQAYVIVWADRHGAPRITVESPLQVAVRTDPGTREVTMAVKRWETEKTTEAVLYGPEQIVHYRAQQLGAVAGFTVVEAIKNPLGAVPVVPFRNTDRLLSAGTSEMADLLPLVDGLNKALADLMVASEYFARPRRWATGIELVDNDDGTEAQSPFPETHRMLVAEPDTAKFGQLPAGDFSSYESAVRILLGQIMAVSALPAHYVGIFTDNPASADALRAAEASLAARAAARQAQFGRSWEQVARLALAVETGVDVDRHQVAVEWADPATRSIAQEADAIVKLHAEGLLSTEAALVRLGYTTDAIPRTSPTDAVDVDRLAVMAQKLYLGVDRLYPASEARQVLAAAGWPLTNTNFNPTPAPAAPTPEESQQ